MKGARTNREGQLWGDRLRIGRKKQPHLRCEKTASFGGERAPEGGNEGDGAPVRAETQEHRLVQGIRALRRTALHFYGVRDRGQYR